MTLAEVKGKVEVLGRNEAMSVGFSSGADHDMGRSSFLLQLESGRILR